MDLSETLYFLEGSLFYKHNEWYINLGEQKLLVVGIYRLPEKTSSQDTETQDQFRDDTRRSPINLRRPLVF